MRPQPQKAVPTPPALRPAVVYVTRQFHKDDRLYGQLSSFFCRSELHALPLDEHYAMSRRNFENLKDSTGAEASELLAEGVAERTPSAIVKAYFNFYVTCAIQHAIRAYRELRVVGKANHNLLKGQPGLWVMSCMRTLIFNSRFYAESWLQSVCDNRTYRPVTNGNEVLLDLSWRAPSFLLMSPFGPRPYEHIAAWRRMKTDIGKTLQTFVADHYENHVLANVEQFAETEEFEAMKRQNGPDMTQRAPTDMRDQQRSPSVKLHPGRAAQKQKTLLMYEGWRTEYRKLKGTKPGHSDVWYSERIASSAVGMSKSAETIRRHLRK